MSVEPRVLWSPPSNVRETTEVGRYLAWLETERSLAFPDYQALWRWSVDDLDGFWSSIWQFFGVRAASPYTAVLAGSAMPGVKWFPGARLNFAEHALGQPEDAERVAVVAHSQTRASFELTFAELREQVRRARTGLQRLGVGPGDRVIAFMPNIPETLVAFLATASLGAIWASCAPELGPRSVIARLAQLEPKVLLTVAGYGFREGAIDRRTEVAAIRAALPTLRHVVHVRYGPYAIEDAIGWDELLEAPAPLAFEQLPFDHPLFVLFTSGTTGLPKAIVHGHGGILLEYLKSHALSWDLSPRSRLLWYSTTSWMLWNALVAALVVRASIVMVDGDPNWPDPGWQWRLAADSHATFMGVSPTFLMACRKAGLEPGKQYDLSKIRVFSTAGSPLSSDGYRYVYEQLGPDVLLINGTGGTDVCTGFAGGSPLLPVYEGEISGRLLGVAADTFDPSGRPVVGELGEFVIRRPMPSMPVALWGDHDGSAYRQTYFDRFPGVWRQGDWAVFTPRGSCSVTGRSDATLNRGGVRLGTSEFYSVVESLPEIRDSLVVHLEDAQGGPGQLLLFVVLVEGVELGDELRTRLARQLRSELSPRHVPDEIHAMPAIPRTLTGKKLETPVKRLLLGAPPERVASRDSLLDPRALEPFAALAVVYSKGSPT